MKSIFVTFLALVLCHNAFCCEVDLTAPGESMEHMRPMNQGDSDLCYAYTMAQMIDAYRFSQMSPQERATMRNFRTSPVFLAIENTLLYRNSSGESSELMTRLQNPQYGVANSGLIANTYETFRQHGACQLSIEQQLTTQPNDKINDPLELLLAHVQNQDLIPDAGSAYLNFCRELYTMTNLPTEVANGTLAPEILNIIEQLYTAEYLRRNNCAANRIRIENPPEIFQISHVPDYVDRSTSRVRQRTEKFYEQNMASIDQGLCKSGQPVAITYCSQMAYDPRYRGMNEYGQDFQGLPRLSVLQRLNQGHPNGPAPHVCGRDVNGAGKHVSIIVGRRIRNGRVQYLLRNTYGPYCDDEREEPNCERSEDHWLDAERVAANVSNLEWMVPPAE